MQLHVIDGDSSILLLSASDFVKTVTNVQFVTKTLEYFDVEESSPDTLESRCPSVTVIKSYVNYLDSKNQVSYTIIIMYNTHNYIVTFLASYLLWIESKYFSKFYLAYR